MRILHTSDWHLGKVLSGFSLEADQRHALEQISAYLAAVPHDVLLIAGDIFDRSTPGEESVRMFGSWLGQLRDIAPNMPVVVIAGNHDNGPRLAWTASLLDHQHVYLRGETDRIAEPIEVRGSDGTAAQIWALPFLLPGAVDETVSSQVGAMDEAIRLITLQQDRTKTQILVAHCFVQDGKTSESERSLIGTATQIDPEVFAGFDYVALGHLHRPQSVGRNGRYSGSIVRYSFSEAGHGKSVATVEVAPGVPHSHSVHPLQSLRGMQRITDSHDALLGDPKYANLLDDYVELTVQPPVSVGNPLEQLRTRWKNILSFRNELVPVASALSTVRTGDGGPRDLEADFFDFNRQFTAGDAPAGDVLAAFRDLHKNLPVEVAE